MDTALIENTIQELKTLKSLKDKIEQSLVNISERLNSRKSPFDGMIETWDHHGSKRTTFRIDGVINPEDMKVILERKLEDLSAEISRIEDILEVTNRLFKAEEKVKDGD